MVDLDFLREFTKGDTVKMKRYINIYLDVAPETFRSMKQHISDKDWEQLRIKAHSLKPQADYMGIPELKSLLVEIEQCVINGACKKLKHLYEQAEIIHTKSIGSLKQFVDSTE